MSDIKSYSKKELDDFWNIDFIVPKRASKPRREEPKKNDVVEISVGSALEDIAGSTHKSQKLTVSSDGTIHKSIYPDYDTMLSKRNNLEEEYSPENSLIKRVRIFNLKSSYSYYEDFICDAKAHFSDESDFAVRVPYFSYVPQYNQLNSEQLAYYIYFRSEARHGRYIDADLSYILLYIYEIINLGDYMDTSLGQSELMGLWRAYRSKHFSVNKSLIDWICDYSLINHLSPPNVPFSDIADNCYLREFFVVYGEGDYSSYANTLLAFASYYDYHTSKFANGDVLKLFDNLIPGALAECVKHASSNNSKIMSAFGNTHIPRDAFSGALCSHRIKKKIDIEYCSFSKTNEFRFWVGDIVKYSENKIRAYSGIKSRLSCYSLEPDVKNILDGFFKRNLPSVRKITAKEKKEEYDRLYELPKKDFSLDDAIRIESESWQTTQTLIDTFEDDNASYDIQPDEKDIFSVDAVFSDGEGTDTSSQDDDTEKILTEALGNLLPFVLACASENITAQREAAKAIGKMSDSIADEINEISTDIIGDIVLEDIDGAYVIVEEYKHFFDNSEV